MDPIEWRGHTWQLSTVSPGHSYSVVCTDPILVDGVDKTVWPTAARVSEWLGVAVRFYDGGDSPVGVETIFVVR